MTGEQDAELVTAEPEGEGTLDVGDRVAQTVGDRDEGLVTGVVAEAVVDLLHAVDVEDEERHRTAGDLGSFERGLEPLVEGAAVGEAGEGVFEGQPLEPCHVLGVTDCGRDVERRGLQELGVVGAERRVAGRRRGPQLTPHLPVHHDRHAELGAAPAFTEPFGDRGHLVRVVDARPVRLTLQQQGLDRGELVERVLLVGREPDLALGEHSDVHEDLQRASIELCSGDRDRGRTERRPGLFGGHLERLRQVVGRRHGAGERGEGRQAPHRGPGRVEVGRCRASRCISIGGHEG